MFHQKYLSAFYFHYDTIYTYTALISNPYARMVPYKPEHPPPGFAIPSPQQRHHLPTTTLIPSTPSQKQFHRPSQQQTQTSPLSPTSPTKSCISTPSPTKSNSKTPTQHPKNPNGYPRPKRHLHRASRTPLAPRSPQCRKSPQPTPPPITHTKNPRPQQSTEISPPHDANFGAIMITLKNETVAKDVAEKLHGTMYVLTGIQPTSWPYTDLLPTASTAPE